MILPHIARLSPNLGLSTRPQCKTGVMDLSLDDQGARQPSRYVTDTEHAHWTWRSDTAVAAECASVVFDVDGVLADASHRQHMLKGRHKSWPRFLHAAVHDEPITSNIELLHAVPTATLRVLLTGRPMMIHDKTLEWFERHEVLWDLLIMRPEGEYGPARDTKQVEVMRLRDRGIDITCVYDDDRRNCDAFEQLGIPTVYVESGYYLELPTNGTDGFSSNVRG